MKRRPKNSSKDQSWRSQQSSSRSSRKTQSVIWWLNVCLLSIGFVCVLFSLYLWQSPSLYWPGPTLALRFLVFSSSAVVIALLGIQGTCRLTMDQCDLSVYHFLIGVLMVSQIIVFIEVLQTSDIEQELLVIWNEWSESKKLDCMAKYDCAFYQESLIVNTTDITEKPFDFANCVFSGVDHCFEDCFVIPEAAVRTFRYIFIGFLGLVTFWELILVVLSLIFFCNSDAGCCSCQSGSGYKSESIQDSHRRRERYHETQEHERKPFVLSSPSPEAKKENRTTRETRRETTRDVRDYTSEVS